MNILLFIVSVVGQELIIKIYRAYFNLYFILLPAIIWYSSLANTNIEIYINYIDTHKHRNIHT